MGDRRLNLGRVAEEVVDEMEEEVVEQPRYNALSFRLLKDIRINDDGDPLSSNHTPPALATSSSHVADAGAGRFEDDGVDANDYRRGGETPHGDAIDDSPPSRTWKHRRGSSGSLASDRERRSALLGMMGFHWTKCVLVNLCVAGIVAAVVVPVVMLTGSKESGGGGAVTSSAGGGGGTLPPAAAVERRDALLAAVLRLPGLPYASSSSLADRESPQSRALDSLASSDAALPDLTDGNASSSWLAQRFALLTLYYSTNGDEWALNLGFTSGEDVCRWNRQVEEFGLGFPYKGVFCFDGDSVDSLVLSRNNLNGRIPPELSLLSDLEVLHLYSNSLSGMIPPSLTALASLTILALNGNRLKGPMPPPLGDALLSLEHLDLSGNELTGDIPKSLERLVTRPGSRLENLDLSRNELTGTVHAGWFYGLLDEGGGDGAEGYAGTSSLKWLALTDNYLSGEVPEPPPLWRRSEDRESSAYPYPSSLLTDVYMDKNFFTGSLSPVLFTALPSLERLGLSDNRLSGALPPEGLAAASNLQGLRLGRNKLRGTLPVQVGLMRNLVVLDLQRNRLSGSLPDGGEGETASWGDLRELRELNLGRNRLGGRLPASMGNSTNLQVLRLERNRFEGEVPRSWSGLTNLETILLANNSITGDVSFICDSGMSSIGLFLADCHGFNAEVICGCCTACCSDKRGPQGELYGCFPVKDDIFGGPA